MSSSGTVRYEDDTIRCTDEAVTLKWYYPWGSKTIPYAKIVDVRDFPLTGFNAVRRWRIWGSGDMIHWWNLDLRRPTKRAALVFELGNRTKPTCTPRDADQCGQIIRTYLTAH